MLQQNTPTEAKHWMYHEVLLLKKYTLADSIDTKLNDLLYTDLLCSFLFTLTMSYIVLTSSRKNSCSFSVQNKHTTCNRYMSVLRSSKGGAVFSPVSRSVIHFQSSTSSKSHSSILGISALPPCHSFLFFSFFHSYTTPYLNVPITPFLFSFILASTIFGTDEILYGIINQCATGREEEESTIILIHVYILIARSRQKFFFPF